MSLDRLNGWKEIAAYLGKGVRTAQRWERDYGLPVRRIGHKGGEIVWASRAELDIWQDRNSNRIRPSQPTSEAQSVPEPALSRRTTNLTPPVLITATAAIVTLMVLAAARIGTTETASQPSRATVEPEFFHVFEAGGRTLFSKHLSFVRKDDFVGPITGKPGNWAQFTDLDGDQPRGDLSRLLARFFARHGRFRVQR